MNEVTHSTSDVPDLSAIADRVDRLERQQQDWLRSAAGAMATLSTICQLVGATLGGLAEMVETREIRIVAGTGHVVAVVRAGDDGVGELMLVDAVGQRTLQLKP